MLSAKFVILFRMKSSAAEQCFEDLEYFESCVTHRHACTHTHTHTDTRTHARTHARAGKERHYGHMLVYN